jgi:hypothetical protein
MSDDSVSYCRIFLYKFRIKCDLSQIEGRQISKANMLIEYRQILVGSAWFILNSFASEFCKLSIDKNTEN